MPFDQSQFVKWSIPAFTLILGLIWYKRRRVDQGDPGGDQNLSSTADLNLTKTQDNIDNNQIISLSDSGIDEPLNNNNFNSSSNSPVNNFDESICSPRKVSQNLDIPSKKSFSLSPESRPWYLDSRHSHTPDSELLLINNPTANNAFSTEFGTYKSKQSASSIAEENNTVLQEKFVEKSKMVDNNIKEDEQITDKETVNNDKPVDNQIDSTTENSIKQQGQAISERDSANHSPLSGLLESSCNDEARSEGSTDSGNGGSINGHSNEKNKYTYEFSVPLKLVGRLIGKGGQFLHHIRDTAQVSALVKRHPTDRDSKLCSITGSHKNISIALDIIRQNFPEKNYSYFTLEPVNHYIINKVPEDISWVPELIQLSLIEGVNNDVVVCNVIKPNHLFVQIPTHPTFPMLRVLDEKMTELYETVESPAVPDQLWKGMILVAKWNDIWARVMVEEADPNGEQTFVKLVDHGGYWSFSNSEMRKINSDFLSIPFQAIEVFLANIEPKEDDWCQDALNVVAQICTGAVGQAQIEGYVDSHTFISLYYNIHKHGVISLADELIARNLAKPTSLQEIYPDNVQPIA